MGKNLFFDFDGMKFDTLPAQVAYINHRYNIKTVATDYIGTSNSLDSIVKRHTNDESLTREVVYKDFGKNFLPSIMWHMEVEPFEGMCEIVERLLQKDYKLWTVTARQRHGMNVIQYLIDKYIPGSITGIHCVWGRDLQDNFVSIPKKEFIANVSGQNIAFFDDSPDEVKDTKDIIPSYLFDPFGWHKDEVWANKTESWQKIGEMLL